MIQQLLNMLDDIEKQDVILDGMDINKEIENMYTYYVLDFLLCKIQGKSTDSAKEGIKKVALLSKKYSK